MVVMVAWGKSSDAKGDRIWHVALASLIAGAGFAVASVSTSSNLVSMIALTFGVMGIYCTLGPLISLPSEFFGDTAAAGGIGLIYALASLGAFVGPFLIGFFKEQTGSYAAGMAVLAIGMLVAAGAALILGRAMSTRAPLARPNTAAE
jgi:ACS family tartrate transporter-like MFS transporter